jgi:hypothetical protein
MFMIDVVAVEVASGHELQLTFADGLTARIDLDRIVGAFEGVFAPLSLGRLRLIQNWAPLSGLTVLTFVQMCCTLSPQVNPSSSMVSGC